MTQQPLSLWPYRMPRWTQPNPTMKAIAADVAQRYGLKPTDLHIKTRRYDICRPRQVAMVEMMRAGKSATRAAGYFGLDHTCAINARDSLAVREHRAMSLVDQAEELQAAYSERRREYAEALGLPTTCGRRTGARVDR